MLKGTVAVAVAAQWGQNTALLAALGAFLGHLYPVWLRFRGGKGVATFLGCALGLKPLVALVFAIVWLATAFLTRYSSLSALVASVATVAAFFVVGERQMGELSIILVVLLWWAHRANITRLLKGTEGKIGQKG